MSKMSDQALKLPRYAVRTERRRTQHESSHALTKFAYPRPSPTFSPLQRRLPALDDANGRR
jgi:hypothetical protein